ncbi:MAG: molecular chaperone SurA, partial [Halieaceae bacterium]|nr:molecular chaperone SurA [Halieaceae bacterium]
MPAGFVRLHNNSTVNTLISLILGVVVCTAASIVSAQIEVLDQVVAIVDDDIVLASELEERVIGIKSSLEARGVDVPADDVLIRETIDRLILDSIQLQLASRYGVKIPDQQLD